MERKRGDYLLEDVVGLARLDELCAEDAVLVGTEELGAEGEDPYAAGDGGLGDGVEVGQVVDEEGELEGGLGVDGGHVLGGGGEDLACPQP